MMSSQESWEQSLAGTGNFSKLIASYREYAGTSRTASLGEMSPGSRGKSGKLVDVPARVRKSVRGRRAVGSGGADGPREGRADGGRAAAGKQA